MKKILLVLILTLIVASCLFPPWVEIYKVRDSNIKKFLPLEYGFIFDKPPSNADAIDFGRLGVQLGLLVFLGCCVRFSKHIFPQKESRPKPVLSDEIPPKKKRKWIKNTLVFICILAVFGYGVFMTMVYLCTENQYSKLREDNSRLATQLREKGQHSSEQRTAEQERARNAQYEDLLTDLDTEYGADCRNAAVQKFNELASDGKVPKGNPAKATRIMERCYKEAKATQQPVVKKSHINVELLDALEKGETPDYNNQP